MTESGIARPGESRGQRPSSGLSLTTLALAQRIDSFIEALEDRAGDGRILIEFRAGKIHHLELGRRFSGDEI